MSGLLSATPFVPMAQGLPIELTYVTLGLAVALSLTAWVVVALRERRDRVSDPNVGRRGFNAAAILFLLVLALWYGTDALVQHDEAVFLYAGSMVAEGALPYERAFDNTGPLGPWFGGLSV